MKFPLMEADLGLSTGGDSISNESVSQPTLNEQTTTTEASQATADQGQSTLNQGPPESIPYERFREVNERAKQAEHQATMLMQYMQQQMMQQQQTAIPQQQQQIAYDPYEELAKFQEDPRAYLQSLRDEIKTETITEFQQRQQAEQSQRTAFERTISKYSDLADDKGKYWVYANAMNIAQQIQGNPMYQHVTWDNIFEYSAQEIAGFRNGGRADGLREAQSRNQQKADAFVEGASNIVPKQSEGLQAQYQKAKESGNAEQMMQIKLRMLEARSQ